VIAYGLHIGTRVEMSTLGETNNAQFFSELATIQALPESMVDLAANVERGSEGNRLT
jgi:hypothetical protein